MRRKVLFFFLASLFFMPALLPSSQAKEIKRYFRMGDGRIHIRNTHTGREANVKITNPDGSLSSDGLSAIDRVFGFVPLSEGDHMSFRLLFLLDYFSDKVAPGRVIHLTSGYRDPAYNQKLRDQGGNVALTSVHMDAMAADFFIEGVKGKRLWEIVRKENCCGIGHYGGQEVHLDSGKPRFWEAATSKVRSGESESNRRIFLSTQYDYYRPNEELRLYLSSISDFSFGVKRTIRFVRESSENEEGGVSSQIETNDECVPVVDRESAKSLRAFLPESLTSGRYRVHVEFCHILFPQMPVSVESNPIEVAKDNQDP
jgi:uncharacterized protein YcbK (DUF882 family)